MYTYFVINNYPDLIISFCVSMAGSFLIIKLASYTEKSKYLNYVGKNSMFFLCVHLFALETMGRYFQDVILRLGISDEISGWAMFVCHVLFATAVTVIIVFFKKRIESCLADRKKDVDSTRDISVDIMKGILIVSMLVGYGNIDPVLRKIIYSCHMAAFVFLSGYFFKSTVNLKKTAGKLIRTFLLPYAGFCVVDLLLQIKEITSVTLVHDIKMYLLGMSFSKNIFEEVPSIGPVYFILLLFVVRLIYLLLDWMIKKESFKIAVVIALSLLGVWLGNEGYWLPWSLDCVLYVLVFYAIGVYFKKYQILKTISNHYIFYFILSSIWAFMIYKASMELAIRQYMPYGLVILGAVSGTVLIYMLSSYIKNNMFAVLGNLFKLLGKNTLYILIVHTLFNGYINQYFARYFDSEYIYHMIFRLVIQLLLGVIVGKIISFIKYRYLSLTNKNTNHRAEK